ncbi:hypothetical protein LTR37_019598 [Vermiconidia calcicola]|uniref:Uncharacterized protein n=1 Tax=Vermiconidia calcicola TaxID=1690605 RepID=A0ACC3MFJ2_9PEZI|nr:hypothetical protein LTR37_019598 [Vermiconidia calcicola]
MEPFPSQIPEPLVKDEPQHTEQEVQETTPTDQGTANPEQHDPTTGQAQTADEAPPRPDTIDDVVQRLAACSRLCAARLGSPSLSGIFAGFAIGRYGAARFSEASIALGLVREDYRPSEVEESRRCPEVYALMHLALVTANPQDSHGYAIQLLESAIALLETVGAEGVEEFRLLRWYLREWPPWANTLP